MFYRILFYMIAFNIILFSCTPQIEGDVRTVVRGNIIDSNGRPIENMTVVSQNIDFDLGIATTDDNGNFEFVSLVSNRELKEIIINPNSEFPSFTIYKIPFVEREITEVFDVGTITLLKKASLNFRIENSSGTPNTLIWTLQYQTPFCSIFYDNQNGTEVADCYPTNTIGGTINIDNPIFEQKIFTTLNSSAIFSYRIDDGVTETVTIPLNSDENTYEFTY